MTTTEFSSIQETLPFRLCQGCDLAILATPIQRHEKAYCPRCHTQLYRGERASLSGNLALALTGLILVFPSYFFPFLCLSLFGTQTCTSLFTGFNALWSAGFGQLALLVAFCSLFAPLLLCIAVLSTHIALKQQWFWLFRRSLSMIQKLKPWVMIDVFLLSIAISCFKLIDMATLDIGPALYSLIALQLCLLWLMSRISVRRYWQTWQADHCYLNASDIHCSHCHLSQPNAVKCLRCQHSLSLRKPHAFGRTLLYLLAASIAMLPANWIAISVVISRGQRLEDTIFSGIIVLFNKGMPGIAVIILIASILVPVIKITGLSYLLWRIHRSSVDSLPAMRLFFLIKWIGKWSMVDLFVITIMMTLLEYGQLLNFMPGYGAIAFAAVVVFTMLAAESLDPRLLWSTSFSSLQDEPNHAPSA